MTNDEMTKQMILQRINKVIMISMITLIIIINFPMCRVTLSLGWSSGGGRGLLTSTLALRSHAERSHH